MESSIEEFFSSLLIKKNTYNVQYDKIIKYSYRTYGIMETSMSQKTNSEKSIKFFFLINQSGICFLQYKYHPIFSESNYSDLILSIKNISKYIIKTTLDVNNFCFNQLYLKTEKIWILTKNKIALIGIFNINCDNSFSKILLIHMFIALLNFKGDTIEKLSLINENEYNIDNTKFNTIQSILKESKKEQNAFKSTDFFEFSIYQMFFLKYIGIHMSNIFDELFQPEEMFHSNFIFKNLYIVDIPTQQIILDFLAVRKSRKNIKYYRNEKLWFELMHHSRMMMESYIAKHRDFYSNSDSSYRYVKLECTSTFPRMIFIIKFIPVLKGLSVIHVYWQKKLSRIFETQEQQIDKFYREIDLLYCSDIKPYSSLFYRFKETKLFWKIEMFLIEFMISIRKTGLFRDYNPNRELKYFNYSIISAINTVANYFCNYTLDTLINNINLKLKEMYEAMPTERNKNYQRTLSFSSKINIEQEKFEALLSLKKEDILNDMFNIDNKRKVKQTEKSKNKENTKLINILSEKEESENSLILSHFEPPKKVDVTIKQSRDISVINISKQIISKEENEEGKETSEILFEQLLDNTSTQINFFPQKKSQKKRINSSLTQNHCDKSNDNESNLNIKMRKDKKGNEQINKQHKLIMFDDKENVAKLNKKNI